MYRGRPSPSPGPRWEALAEPSSANSSSEEDEMEDEIERPTNAPNPSSSQRLPPRKRKDLDVPDISRKRPRYNEQGGERTGSISAPGGSRSGNASGNLSTASLSALNTAGPSRASNAIPTPTASISAGPRPASGLMPPPPVPSQFPSRKERRETGEIIAKRFPMPSRTGRPISNVTEADQHTASSSKSKQKAPEASSSQRKDIPSSLTRELFARSQAGPSSSKAHPQPKGQPKSTMSNEIIDLTEDIDDPPPPRPKPKPKPKSRSSMPNGVIDMSDEERLVRPKPRPRKSTGDILNKPPTKTTNNASAEVIEISSGSEDEPPPAGKVKEVVRKLESILSSAPRAKQAKEINASSSKTAVQNDKANVDVSTRGPSELTQIPASGSVSVPKATHRTAPKPSSPEAVASNNKMNVDLPARRPSTLDQIPASGSSSVPKATQAFSPKATSSNERMKVDLPTRRPSELTQIASTSVPKANQAKDAKPSSSMATASNERMNVGLPTRRPSELTQIAASGSTSVPKANQAKETNPSSSVAAASNERMNVGLPTRRPSALDQIPASGSSSVPKATQGNEAKPSSPRAISFDERMKELTLISQAKDAKSSATASNEMMNVGLPPRRPSGSTSVPKANQAKETNPSSLRATSSNERMNVDLPTRRPLEMVPVSASGPSSLPNANSTTPPSPKMTVAADNERMDIDVPTTASIAKPQRIVSADATPDQRTDSRKASSRDMQVDQVQTTQHLRSDRAMINSVASTSTPSTGSKPPTPAFTSKSPKHTQQSVAGSQRSTPAPVPGASNLPSKTPNRTQIAVKSAGGTKPRLQRFPSSSSSSSQGEPDKETSSPHPSPGSSSAAGGIDMRDLDHALGLTAPPKRITTPERAVPVKEQPISPQISTAMANFKRPKQTAAPQTTLGQAMQDPVISAGQSNTNLRNKGAGDTREDVIDLTLDSDEEISPNHPSLQSAKESSKKLVDILSKLKGKGPAVSPPQSPAESPRSGTDELLLRPAEREPSPPPSSPSPLQTPVIPAAKHRITEAGPSGSTAQAVLGNRHHSAPSVAETASMQPIRAQHSPSTLVSASMNSIGPSGLSRPQIRPASLGSISHPSITEVLPQKLQITDVRPASETSLPSSLPSSPQVPSAEPHVIPSPPCTNVLAPPATEKSPSPRTGPSEVALGKRPEMQQETVQSDASKNMYIDAEEVDFYFNAQSEDEAMETEEVQALFDQGSEEMAEQVHTGDVARYNPEPFRVRIPSGFSASAESLSAASGFNDSSEAGPSRSSPSISNALRRSSRRSSRSSASLNWPPTSDDDNIVPDSAPVSRNTTPEEAPAPAPPSGKTYGGFPAFTWPEYRKDLTNFIPKTFYAKDLPTSFQDHINNMSEYTRRLPDMRAVYEGMIQENTVSENAPPIELKNDVDDEPTPPWEFHYTNEMWHGENVPDPDMENLISCNCKGPCNPRSKTCACLARQRVVSHDPNLEFAYDKNGRLKIPGFPVFECNNLCRCGDECRNRVVQHGRKVQVAIKKTQHKGWGVFAGSKKIPAWTFIGIYAGELLTDEEAHDRGVNYNKFGRTYLFDLDFHHQRLGPNWTNQFTVDAYHAGNFTRFLNHSCDPNCRLYPCYINEGNIQKPLLVIFARRDIEPNEEICFSYRGKYPEDDDDGDDESDDENAKEGSGSGKQDKIYERCMCGAQNCTGIMFRPAPASDSQE